MKKLDLQDWLVIAGFASLESGVAAIYWPAALVLGGLLCFGFALLIERASRLTKPAAEGKR